MLLLIIKILLTILISVPNLMLTYKIVVRPHIHSIFNTSMACFFCIGGFFGPILYVCLIDIVHHQHHDQDDPTAWIDTCCRYIELKHLLVESLKIISSNIMFRFFFIVYADKGFVSNGLMNTRLFKICFIVMTMALTFSGYFSYILDKARDKDYPQNTIKGRICLNLRLDWDKNDSKKTKDLYIKSQLLVASLTIGFGSLYAYLIRRVRIFLPSICISNTSHACLGGKYRKNFLIFNELSVYFFFIISEFLISSLLIVTLYSIQDKITQNGVFMVYFAYATFYDTFHLIIIPIAILVRSRTNYPIIWTNYKTKNIKFFTNLKPMVKPKEMREPESTCSRYLDVKIPLPEIEC